MENSINVDLKKASKSSLIHWVLVIVLFVLISSLFNYVYFKDIFLVAEGRAEDYEWKNFLIYNLGVKWILYPFKFMALAGLMRMGIFLFKVEKIKLSIILKVIILAELVKYLPEVLRILWFTFIDFDNLEGYDMGAFNDNLSLNGLVSLTKENTIYPLFKFLSITQVCYILVVAQLLKIATDKSFIYHLRWFSICYGGTIILLELGSTILNM